MAIETIGIKYTIPKLSFDRPASTPQIFILELKLANEPDSSFTIIHPNYQTDTEGNNIDGFMIPSLAENTDYSLRFTNKAYPEKVFTKNFRTALNLSSGNNPYLDKIFFKGQTIDWYYPGLMKATLADTKGGFFFNFDGNYREVEQNFGNMVPVGGISFKAVAEATLSNRKLQGFYFDGSKYAKFNDDHTNRDAQIRANDLFGNNSDKSYSIFFFFHLEDRNDKVILHTVNDAQNEFKISHTGRYIVVSVTKNGVTNTASSASQVVQGRWYMLGIKISPGTPTANTGYLYHPTGNINFPTISQITHSMVTTAEPTIYLGRDVTAGVTTTGLVVSRFFYSPSATMTNQNLNKLSDPWGQTPKVMFQKNGESTVIQLPEIWRKKLDDLQLSFTVPSDTTLVPGSYDCWIQNYQGNKLNLKTGIQIQEFNKATTGFDIDLSQGAFADRVNEFKNTFYGLHGQWGGANGGVNANLIYFNPDNRTVQFEAHGDRYNGEVQGVGKQARDASNTGYGLPKLHDHPEDPLNGQAWKTRVGAVAVSKAYCGYGEWSTWMKIPKESYGYCLALWIFHYQEFYPADPLWQHWIDKGGKPYGGEDSYMVINHEIDMELPSHLAMGVVESWAELATCYFDPKAMDTKFHIAVQAGATADDIGLFRLIDPSLPNQRSSWVKVSDDWEPNDHPSYSNLKFNNWIGEKDSGKGFSSDKSSYDVYEEYLALLTKTEHNYADEQFHKWTIKWVKDKTQLWIDDVLVRENRAFVPYIPGRLTFGAWFPSAFARSSETPWLYDPNRAWAGHPADFSTLNLEISRISYRPYTTAEAGGDNEYYSETTPEANLRELV